MKLKTGKQQRNAMKPKIDSLKISIKLINPQQHRQWSEEKKYKFLTSRMKKDVTIVPAGNICANLSFKFQQLKRIWPIP